MLTEKRDAAAATVESIPSELTTTTRVDEHQAINRDCAITRAKNYSAKIIFQ
jgi:hypothetical protein